VPAGSDLENFFTNMPRAEMVNPGIFAELTKPWSPNLRSTIGGRIDWVSSDARAGDLRVPSALLGAPGNLSQNDLLGAFFLRNELQITDHWSVELSAGYAERAPTLMERYADGLFVGVNQSGFTRMVGDPDLDKERLWQVDVGVRKEKG